ncbi:hypothetical protein Belba_2583 [Belliella baltica DSM 15883]|uniref:Uncharacterized protein n=1 Tax=Belliella baltica (strain DSM 15883 / CIP 108006 / LMG 21964 / BA134) TaxID=866536 RepID=I3Z7B4_BELBD|nr:hypothetical protein [Belliella baltica]AFL85132.1 hypothetical protein Belba_2583 [Belliella baltica DSM 15883]
METKEEVLVKEKLVKLVDGEFTPDQAMEILRALIDQKINYHKIENQQNWERNHNIDSEPFFKRIQELEEEKKNIYQYISNLKKEGKSIEIKGVLTVKPVI